MRRLILPLLLLPLTACIERTPQADDDPPLECGPADCGQSPDIAGCPDGTAPVVTCEAEGDACGWQVGECPDVEPEPGPVLVECAPDACGLPPDGGGCESGFDLQIDCVAGIDSCGWQVICVPVDPSLCDPNDCGQVPQGEPCGPAERSIQECRDTRNGCEWYLACEPLECGPADCPDDPPLPNCEHTLECVPMDGACGWLAECVVPTCEQPWDPGTCRAIQPVWWYNGATNACELRDYGGCEGNDNRFETEEACWQACAVLGK